MKKLLFISVYFFWTISNCLGQTASIKVVRQFYDNSFDKFDSIIFLFNGTKFTGNDTIGKNIKLNTKFDNCMAIIGKDTLQFYTKFKTGGEYIIKPGCCCAAFTLEAKNNSKRGTIYFKNTTKRDLGLVIAEANVDTVYSSKAQTTFAFESAMCLFKPCSILLTETNYLSGKYDYQNDKKDYDQLWAEQKKFILAISYYHFLHGEKVEIIYNEKLKSLELKLLGYLTDKEYDNWWK